MNKAYQYYKDLPPWAKGAVVVGGGIILFYVGYTIVRRIRKVSELRADLQESDDAKNDLRDLQNQGVKPTLSSTQIESIVTALVEAMNDCGTDEDAVYNQFKKLNNIADVYALVSKWGIRYYRPCAIQSPISYAKWLSNNKSFGGNLSSWLNYDLSQSEITKVNKILSDKGIKYKF